MILRGVSGIRRVMDLETHSALLSTGVRLPLPRVAACLRLLDRLLSGSAEDRALVVEFRRACLSGESAPRGSWAALNRYGFAYPDGEIEPAAREVVLAAVRGEGSNLYLMSPYVSFWDKTLSDFYISRRAIRAALSEEEAERLIAGGRDTTVADGPGGSWLDYVSRLRPSGGTPPPPFVN